MTAQSPTASAPSGSDRFSLARLGSQTVLLTGGFGFAQVLSFGRNAVLGHLLSVGDFGLAAALTVTLQLVEMISDIAADRMLVQAEDGDSLELLAAAHSIMLCRGIALAVLLWLTGPLAATLFLAPKASLAFQALSVVPLVKGLMHLDWRRAQRRLDNAPSVLIEIAAQCSGLLVIWPAVVWTGDYRAVLISAFVQSVMLVAVSHYLAMTPWRLSSNRGLLLRFTHFGWPILLSAIPLIAVFQGDRIIVARFVGIEAFALYSAAFMITLVPATLITRIGQTLMLPLSAGVRTEDAGSRLHQFTLLTEISVLVAALYLVGFAILGDLAVTIAFGAAYGGQSYVIAAITAMWACRLLQMPVQALLMAQGRTVTLLVAGVIRAGALPLALCAAIAGVSLPWLALCGAAGELASLAFLAGCANRVLPGTGWVMLSRTAFLLLAAGFTMSALFVLGADATLAKMLAVAVGALLMTAFGAITLPAMSKLVFGRVYALLQRPV
jgi:O-antigen/teichoic acid export membrane protein